MWLSVFYNLSPLTAAIANSSEARRQSMAVNEAEENIKTKQKKGLTETFTKISNLESSIVNLDWELERFEIEKMKAKTEKVMKQMSLSGRNGFNGEHFL